MDAFEYFRSFMWITAFVTMGIDVVLGVLLGYVWMKFTMDQWVANVALLTYTVVSIVLVLTMFSMTPPA